MDRDHEVLDPIMKPLDADEVDSNGGVCGLGHRVMEDIMKPTMKKGCFLVVNVWSGGNITEVALVSLNPPLFYTPIGWQPIQLALNLIVTCATNSSLSIVIAIPVHFRFSVVAAVDRYVELKRFSHD
jgi:hypothetical protein